MDGVGGVQRRHQRQGSSRRIENRVPFAIAAVSALRESPVHVLVLQMDLLSVLHDVEVVEGRRPVGEAHHLL